MAKATTMGPMKIKESGGSGVPAGRYNAILKEAKIVALSLIHI